MQNSSHLINAAGQVIFASVAPFGLRCPAFATFADFQNFFKALSLPQPLPIAPLKSPLCPHCHIPFESPMS
jgi:hypothetical protein